MDLDSQDIEDLLDTPGAGQDPISDVAMMKQVIQISPSENEMSIPSRPPMSGGQFLWSHCRIHDLA